MQRNPYSKKRLAPPSKKLSISNDNPARCSLCRFLLRATMSAMNASSAKAAGASSAKLPRYNNPVPIAPQTADASMTNFGDWPLDKPTTMG